MKLSMLNIKPIATVSALALALFATGCVCTSRARPDSVRTVAAADRDSDGDGVMDSQDRCPRTPTGFKVNDEGCIVEQTVILRTVNFAYNSDRLTAPSEESLDQVAAALIEQPNLNVQVAGHTDSVGSERFNQILSKKRALSVRHYLISKGVAAKNLQAAGFGKTKPIASNETADGRTENRRVEFAIVEKPQHLNVLRGASSDQSKAAAKQIKHPKHH